MTGLPFKDRPEHFINRGQETRNACPKGGKHIWMFYHGEAEGFTERTRRDLWECRKCGVERECGTDTTPARVLVIATIVVPGDQAMPLPQFEAYIAQAFKDAGVLPLRVGCEFIEEAARV